MLVLVMLACIGLASGCGSLPKPQVKGDSQFVAQVDGHILKRLKVDGGGELLPNHWVYYFDDDKQPVTLNYNTGSHQEVSAMLPGK